MNWADHPKTPAKCKQGIVGSPFLKKGAPHTPNKNFYNLAVRILAAAEAAQRTGYNIVPELGATDLPPQVRDSLFLMFGLRL